MRSPLISTFLVFLWLVFSVTPSSAQPGPGEAASGRSLDKAVPSRIMTLLKHRSIPIRADGSKAAQQARLAGEKAPASLQAIVMMCDFSDSLMFGRYGQVPGDFPPPRQSEIYYSAHDEIFFNHLFGDVADYYQDVSDGALTFNYTVHPRIVNLSHPMGYYGNHPEQGEQPISLAVDLIAELDGEIDFSLFDTFILVHAGAGEETDILGNSPEQIYSNYLDADDFQEAFEDGKLENPWIPSEDFGPDEGIDQVLILPECEYQDPVGGFGGFFGSLGVYCFEVGLRLGMLSLSDFTPSGFPDSQGIGEFGLMGYGLFVGMGWIPPHPCAFNKMLMGWLEPQDIDPLDSGQYFLTPCESAADPEAGARVAITGREYWLLAYRLQDPDGNRIFSFPGDLNGNNVPDFWDEDSPWGNGVPQWGATFDPDSGDIHEELAGAEWDFFMSENSARIPGVKGAGSGIYIWHVDEGVIQDVFGSASNLFNADPQRKSVDLEEADGIQDLDSREPSPFILGGDDDSFRQEGNDHFGAATVPNTKTAGGALTNVDFRNISSVVLDSTSFIVAIDSVSSPPDTLWGLVYADTMFFELGFGTSGGVSSEIVARRELPSGINLRGSHLLLADLGGEGSAEEIIVAGSAGEVFVLDGDLNEFRDHDADASTVEPFVVGTLAGEPVPWNQPVAAGDLDGDGQPEIVLTGPGGLYAFAADATSLQPDPVNVGLLVPAEACSLPPVLIPENRSALFGMSETVEACVVFLESGESHVRLYGGNPANLSFDFNLGAVRVVSPPVYSWDTIFVAVDDTVNGIGKLVLCAIGAEEDPADPQWNSFDLLSIPGSFPVLLGLVSPAQAASSLRYAVVPGNEDQAETLFFSPDNTEAKVPSLWDSDIQLLSPLAPGGFFVGDGVLGQTNLSGTWAAGWPRRPHGSFLPNSSPTPGGPLVGKIKNNATAEYQALFPVQDGQIYCLDQMGVTISGWPAAGPAGNVGSPALGPVRGSTDADLVALGAFNRITGLGEEDSQLQTEEVSTLTVWSGVAQADPLWPMWGGSPWRNGSWDMSQSIGAPPVFSGAGFVADSHICYPSPLGSGPLNVRAKVQSDSQVRAVIFNLDGEEVFASDWVSVQAGDAFNISCPLRSAVSGMYLCRLVSESKSGQSDTSVLPFAIVR